MTQAETLSLELDTYGVLQGKPPGSLSPEVGKPPLGRSFHKGHCWYSLHYNTQVTLCREGHMAGISIELHQGIGPVRPSGGKLGELLGCIIYHRNPSLVRVTHTMASLYTLSPTAPSLGSTSRKATSLQNFWGLPHVFRWVREASSDWVSWQHETALGADICHGIPKGIGKILPSDTGPWKRRHSC